MGFNLKLTEKGQRAAAVVFCASFLITTFILFLIDLMRA